MLPRVDAGRTIGPIPLRDGAQLVDFYPWLKVLHILFAIVAVGFNVSYGIWLFRAAREPEHAGWALRGIKFMDDRVANPSYIGLAVVGVLLVLTGPWEFTDLWVAGAIVLYVLLAIVALGAYSPTPAVTPALEGTVMERIVLPTVRAMVSTGEPSPQLTVYSKPAA